jgi:hypothetical protein
MSRGKPAPLGGYFVVFLGDHLGAIAAQASLQKKLATLERDDFPAAYALQVLRARRQVPFALGGGVFRHELPPDFGTFYREMLFSAFSEDVLAQSSQRFRKERKEIQPRRVLRLLSVLGARRFKSFLTQRPERFRRGRGEVQPSQKKGTIKETSAFSARSAFQSF